MKLIILAGHPFFRYSQPAILEAHAGRFRGKFDVRWRDFSTQKCDCDYRFNNRAAAENFAAKINRPPMTIQDEDWDAENYCEDIVECDRFWRDL